MSEEGGREKEGGTERGMVRLLQGVWGGSDKGGTRCQISYSVISVVLMSVEQLFG